MIFFDMAISARRRRAAPVAVRRLEPGAAARRLERRQISTLLPNREMKSFMSCSPLLTPS
jgi:hypothetical protein